MDPNGGGSTQSDEMNAMTDINGNASSAEASASDGARGPVSYDDLFPSLPTSHQTAQGVPKATIGEWNRPRKPVVANTTITHVFRIPYEERKDQQNAFGEDMYKLLKGVMDRIPGVKIEMSASRDQSLTFLITGKQDLVQRARRELLTQFQTQSSQFVSIPKEHHRFILGKGGAKLQELERQTSTKISIPKMNDPSDKITVSGTREGIEKAVHEICIISDEQSKQAYEVLSIPKHFHPFISGPGGETAKRIISEHSNGNNNVRINIPPPSVMKNELSVAGERDAVLRVVAYLRNLHAEMERKFGEVSIEVKKSQHKYIIGPRGNTINEILNETGVHVEMPSPESSSETVTLRGPQEKLGLALTKVYEKANSVVSYDLDCPSWLHKYIIGKKGASIQKLTNDLPKVHVEFADDKVKIEGPPEEVDKAKMALEAQANELKATMIFVDVPVDAKYHKHIIGKGGSTVNRIKQETDVMINIPGDVESGLTNIRIEGQKAGVLKAKEELVELIKRMENEREKDLIIENRFHRQLIGPKGENIQKIRDEFPNVQISFPDLGSKSDIVKLRGPRDEVEKVAKQLNKTSRELLENSYQSKVPIFKQFHKFVIGKGGVTIRKIRSETDTKIDLPEPGSDSDMIVVTGKKANVEKAQQMILKIQTEMANVVSVDVSIPSHIHNTMIGSGGKLIQSVMDDCGGVSIKFPPSDSKSDKVTIRGPKDDVEKARLMLVELSNEKQLSSLQAEVRARPEHHKFLIGRHGSNIQGLRDRTGARIIFPSEQDKDRELITILGTKEAVASAKKELEERIKGLDNIVEETMVVEPKYHKHFVSRRGEVLRQIGEEFGGVIVSFPRAGVQSDKVTLKGAKNCLDGARKRIEDIVDELQNQVTITCVIEQVHHRSVMGTRGSHIQQICQEHDVQIKIPDRNRNDGAQTQNNGSSNPQDEIKITGKKENCERASAALKALVPISEEVSIPFEYHRFVIGSKGSEVRHMMETYDVNIKVPAADQQSDKIVVTGTPSKVADAKEALASKVKTLDAEKADRELKNFEVKFEVDPFYHPKIIGRSGTVIQQLRDKFDVRVQMKKPGESEERTITVVGYEENALKAKEAILNIVKEYDSKSKVEVDIDPRVHRMIIGKSGSGIRRLQNQFNVEIKLQSGSETVLIVGNEDNCMDCRDELLNLEEEHLQDIIDREMRDAYLKPPSQQDTNKIEKTNNKGFEVTGAPWQGNTSEDNFPSLGGTQAWPQASEPNVPVWGPSSRR